jgi:hypothetical protein
VLSALTQAAFLAFLDDKLLAPHRRLLGVWVYSIGTPGAGAAGEGDASGAGAGSGPALPAPASDAMVDEDGGGAAVAAPAPAAIPDWVSVAAGLAPDGVVLGPSADLGAWHAAHPVFCKPSTL